MKKVVLILTMLCSIFAVGQIQQPAPFGVISGNCVQLTSSNPSPVWTLNAGGEGTVSSTGLYCAPTSEFVQSYSAGAQQFPNDAYINRPVQNDPVHPSSAQWVARLVQSGQNQMFHITAGPRFFGNFDQQQTDITAPTQVTSAEYFVHYQNVALPWMLPPLEQGQDGFSLNPYGSQTGGTGPDRREMFVQHLPNGMGTDYAYYEIMPDSHNYVVTPGNPTTISFSTNQIRQQQNPIFMNISGVTGSCSNLNGTNLLFNVVSQIPATDGYTNRITVTYSGNSSSCPVSDFTGLIMSGSGGMVQTANVGTMEVWNNWDNTSYRSTTAGGLPIIASGLDSNQWYHNVVDNITDPNCKGSDGLPRVVAGSHVIGFTVANSMISGDNLGAATTGNGVTYGHPLMEIASITPGNPTIVTSAYNLGTGGLDGCISPTPWLSVPAAPNTCVTKLRFQGFTGAWAALNDNVDHSNSYSVEASQYSYTIPVDSTTWGPATINNNQFAKFDWPTYGSTFRLDTIQLNPDNLCTGGVTTDCPFEKAALWTLACYGGAIDDGGDVLEFRKTSNGFEPAQIVNAGKDLAAVKIAPYLQVVDPAGVMPLNYPGANNAPNNQLLTTNFRRTIVSDGSSTLDINIVGAEVQIYPEKLPLIYPGTSYKPTISVTGAANSAYTCGLETSVNGVTIAQDGTITTTNVTTPIGFKERCISVADPTKVAYASGYLEPVSTDGSWRLWWGLKPNITISTGETFYGQVANIVWSGGGQVFESPQGSNYSPFYGSLTLNPNLWTGVTDSGLYGNSISVRNDVAWWAALPNGPYIITLYGEAGAGVTQAGTGFDYEISTDGKTFTIVDSNVDPFVRAGGAGKGYQHVYNVVVTNNILEFGARDRIDSTLFPYGGSPWSALKIAPGQAQPTLALNVAPTALPISQGHQGTATATTSTSGGFNASVTLSAVAPTGITVTFSPATIAAPGNGNSTITFSVSGTLAIGTYPVTITASGAGLQESKTVTISVTANVTPVVVTTTSCTNGVYLQINYSCQLSASGGNGTYTWSSVGVLPVGLVLYPTGQIAGIPKEAGNFVINVKACDTEVVPVCSVVSKVTLTITNNPVTITTTSLPTAFVGIPYPGKIVASGGYTPYTFTIVSGQIPPGLTFNSNGTFLGSAKISPSVNTYSITVKVTDSKGQTATSGSLTITVKASPNI